MYYVYFVFCGYRVAIGKAKNLHDRLGTTVGRIWMSLRSV